MNHKFLKNIFPKIVFSAFALFFCAFSLSAQSNFTVTGVITDENGAPMPGANVVVKGSTRGVTTDIDGSYSFTNLKASDVLEFSFVGYEPVMIAIEDQRRINVQLQPKANELDEVTIVAFGKQKKTSVVSSIETVNVADLKIPSSNLTSALAGRVAGLISYQTSGEPGADNADFFVRGVTTFGYKAEPLYLIDGFEVTKDDLARLQPDDIESFSVLKDASASVMYGARGANGIIIVTTKPGREGPVKVSARLDMNVATPTRTIKTLDGVQYMKMYNEAQITRNPNLGLYYSEQKIRSTERGENPMIYPNVDWYDMLFKRYTLNNKANINVSGGGKVATYYVAGGFDHETGLLKVDSRNNFNNNININRVNIRTNVIFKLTESTTLDTRIQGRFERYNGPWATAKSIFQSVMSSNPVDFPAVFEPDAERQNVNHTLFGSTSIGDNNFKVNPYAQMVMGYEDRNENTIIAQATLMQDLDFITPGLKLQAKASANTWSQYSSRRSYWPFFYTLESYNQVTEEFKLFCLNPFGEFAGRPYLGPVNAGRDARSNFYYEARLNWDRKFGNHSVSAMTVVMVDEKLLTGGNSSDIYETLPERNAGNSGRVTYDFDTRYFFEFAYGYNGSEKFTGEKRYGFFPSFGAGWLISNEKFWQQNKDIISNLKLKFTWGMVGNDAIAQRKDRFFFLSEISGGGSSSFRFGEDMQNYYPGYTINRYANPDITWEVAQKFNVGLEVGLFKNESVKLQVDLFKDYRSQIYMTRENFPFTAGLEATISGNVGKVSSQGIDGSIDFQHNFNKDFWMTGRANFTYATSKYVELDEKNFPDEYLKKKGYSPNQEWGLVAERLFVDQAEIENSPKQDFDIYMAGDIKYTDINKDGVVNSNDRIPMGFPTVPEIQYGFGLQMGYKKFDLAFFFQGSARTSFFINSGVGGSDGDEGIAPFYSRRNALKMIADDYWTETNPNVYAFWPRLATSSISNNTQQSSWWLRDGSFLRLKSVEVGYSLPNVHKLKMNSARVYFSGENMALFSRFKLWDPEQKRKGLGYPLNRRFNLGIQLMF